MTNCKAISGVGWNVFKHIRLEFQNGGWLIDSNSSTEEVVRRLMPDRVLFKNGLDLMWIDDQPFNEILDNRAHNDSFGVLNS